MENIAKTLLAEKKDKFDTYCSLLQEYNQRYNLTAITQTDEVFEKHFYDSLLGVSAFPQNANVLEVGSGGGFPSLPVKICRPDLTFTLLEATGKKCQFLSTVVRELDLQNVTVLNGRAEEYGKTAPYREGYDAVCARAVARLNVLLEYCLPFVKVGGVFIAYKGDAQEEIAEAKTALKILGGQVKQVLSYTLPSDNATRQIVVIQKTHATPANYPRGNGQERKKPLL